MASKMRGVCEKSGVQTLALVGGTQNEVAGWKIEEDEFIRHSSADAR